MRTYLRLCILSVVVTLLSASLPSVAHAAPPATRTPVIVVGGGLAGLVTAYELEKRGIVCTVLDASDRLGGRVATAEYDNGLQGEFGMQEVWEKSPLLGIIRELGLPTEESPEAWSSFLIDGRIDAYTQDTRDAYFHALFSPDERKAFDATIREMESLYREAERDGLTARISQTQAISWADWLAARKLPAKVEQVLRITIEVELGAVSEQFSALSALLEWRVFLFGGEKNYHVTGGNSRIIEALAAKIRGPKVLNARVIEIKRTPLANGRFDCEVVYHEGRFVRRLHADAVVVAIPWVHLHGIQFAPQLDEARWSAVNTLGRGQYTVVHYILGKAADALWPAENPFPILSGGPLGVIYGLHGKANAAGQRLFTLLIYGLEAQAYHMKPRDLKRTEMLAALDTLWPGFSKCVEHTYVYGYHPASVAYWPPGRSPLDAGSRLLRTPVDGLFLAGDWLYSSHSEGAAISGIAAAKDVAAYLKR